MGTNLFNEGIENSRNNINVLLVEDLMLVRAMNYQSLVKILEDLELDKNFVSGTLHHAENTNSLND